MFSYYLKKVESSEELSNKYIHVNNFGYYEDVVKANVCREHGRIDYQLIYVKSGELTLHKPSGDDALIAGDICLFRPSEAQMYGVVGEPTTYFWIHFSGNEAEKMLSFFEEKAYNVGPFPEFERYCRGFFDEFNGEPQYTELLYEGELIALIARIAERVSCDEKKRHETIKIRPALCVMRSDCKIRRTNDELALLCGISRHYFVKIFKSVTGVTPQKYYISLLIDKARFLLSTTSYNIGEIALECGMEDSLYFSRLFKKHTGLSPMAYRKNV